MKRFQIFCMMAGLFPVFLSGAVWDWKTYTAMTEFSQLAVADSLVWGATQGGLAAFDPQARVFTTWTNTEGLANNNVSAIASDDSGRIWIGFKNGLMQRFDPRIKSFSLISDYKGYPITCLAPVRDTLFVGLDIGVSMYLVSRQEVKETYRRLGPKLQVEIPVVDIAVSDKTLWIATDQGVAFASLENVNLLDPQSWTNITIENELPSNHVRALSAFQGSVYIGTDGGVLRASGSNRDILNAGLSNVAIRDIAHDGAQLYVLTADGVYHGLETGWMQLGSSLSTGISLAAHADLGLFAGLSEGTARLDATTGQWEKTIPNSPLDSRVTDLAVDHEGILWTGTAVAGGHGFGRFDGTEWTNFTFPALSQDIPNPLNNVMAVAVDPRNRKWFGTFGGGAIFLENDTTLTVFNNSNSLLVGYDDTDHKYEPVIQDVACESNGAVWFADFSSYIGKPLVSFSHDSVWTNFGSTDGIGYTRIKKLMIDSAGRKWIGTENNGVLVFDDNGTPADKSDDRFAGTVNDSEGLDNLSITALAEDEDGTIWIGTKLGLYTYVVGDPQVTRVYWPSSDNISAIEVDGANNIWVGHDAGISYRRNDDYTWHHFFVDNSPLASDRVFSLDSDPETGVLYIGTAEGLSVLETPFSEPREAMEEIRLYPNPFKPAEHQTVTIDELTSNVAVHIYSTAGFLVRKYPQNEVLGRRILWDGRNEDGQPVSSGIYLVVEKSESGEKRIGKLAVIR